MAEDARGAEVRASVWVRCWEGKGILAGMRQTRNCGFGNQPTRYIKSCKVETGVANK